MSIKMLAQFVLTSLLVTASCTSAVVATEELPMLNVDGFAWAENLAFDGLGNLFVSEAVRGELWKINLSSNGTEYQKDLFITKGVDQFGGLAITPDGSTIYAGATMADKSYAILSAATAATDGTFQTVAVTKNQANGLACDFESNVCYMTDEGTGSDEGGTVVALDLATGQQTTIKDQMAGADGAWFDAATKLLFVGELFSKKIQVFDASKQPAEFSATYTGLNDALGAKDMLDDLTLMSTVNAGEFSSTVLLGCDWTGKSVKSFALDGTNVATVPAPEGVDLLQVTSVRWGKGPGFDEGSIYVTEGGGATPHVTNRRVLQIKMN